MPSKNLISESSEWNFPLLKRFDQEIARIAHDEYGLDTYANQIEVINYHHWSFGKQFVATEQTYRRGQMGLAYEIVINSDPCIAYLMEENTLPMQALVIAHASYGHNSFFKGNYLFRAWTSADAIIDYLVFARAYIAECEERYGYEEVEALLDSCHALMNYGVDRYKRPAPLSMAEEKRRQHERESYLQSQINDLWRTLPVDRETEQVGRQEQRFPEEPQENLLYFIEKNAPLLEPWQREIVRIVRKVGQYFYPQRQTQVMNEGWATFWHYTLLNQLYDEGLINDGFMIEILQSHTNVVFQPGFDAPYYNGINPYALGFAMMRDIRRICEEPTPEDREWFPDIAGQDWLQVLDFAMRNFKDESFIAQFLSPKLMRDFRLFGVRDDDREDTLEITSIHDEAGYRSLRQYMAEQYNLGSREPNIQVYNVDLRGDRSMTLRHYRHNRRPLGDSVDEMLLHIRRLWGFDIRLESVDEQGRVQLIGDA
ncbi:MAG: SpoVR family protein [Thiohalocapsa sp. PB-PSB1]|nr:MAG: SpoVR family protein [Thiohalocapsa sp. PB-PSB1]